jgi:hypothetical protein
MKYRFFLLKRLDNICERRIDLLRKLLFFDFKGIFNPEKLKDYQSNQGGKYNNN